MNPINVTKNGTLTLNTANKYVEDNIKVNVNVPSSSKELKVYQSAHYPDADTGKFFKIPFSTKPEVISYTICMEGIANLGDIILCTDKVIMYANLFNGYVACEPNPTMSTDKPYYDEGELALYIPTSDKFNEDRSYVVIIYYY